VLGAKERGGRVVRPLGGLVTEKAVSLELGGRVKAVFADAGRRG